MNAIHEKGPNKAMRDEVFSLDVHGLVISVFFSIFFSNRFHIFVMS